MSELALTARMLEGLVSAWESGHLPWGEVVRLARLEGVSDRALAEVKRSRCYRWDASRNVDSWIPEKSPGALDIGQGGGYYTNSDAHETSNWRPNDDH